MKVAVSATAPTLDAAVDPRFGRCSTGLTGTPSFTVGDEIFVGRIPDADLARLLQKPPETP